MKRAAQERYVCLCVAARLHPSLLSTSPPPPLIVPAQYTLHKPRTLSLAWVIVPVSELSHPLRHYNYYENLPAVPWTLLKKDVPVQESRPKANTVLVSTLLRW
jgi:hypothetical protein